MPDSSQIANYARILKLREVGPAVQFQAQSSVSRTANLPQARNRRPRLLVSMLLLFLLPSCLSAVYFFLVAADRYVSQVRFVLRSPHSSVAAAPMTALLQSSGVTRSNDDGFIVQAFLESRDAMTWLQDRVNLKAIFASAKWDPYWRLPALLHNETEEGLYQRYSQLVSSTFDKSTGINGLEVQAFTAQDAQTLAGHLLAAAEKLVNRINDRANRDASTLAEDEVHRARERVHRAQAALTGFRERERLVDPGQAILAVVEAISRLAGEASRTSVQINELTSTSPNSPQIVSLRTRRAALEQQIATERDRLAGDAKSIAPRISEYERLMLEREFAHSALVSAMASLELARVEGLRQQVYLELVATPGRPDYPAYPWRFFWCGIAVAASYMSWRIWCILSADARRHAVQ